MKSFSWHSRAPTRQRIPACYDPPRAGCPTSTTTRPNMSSRRLSSWATRTTGRSRSSCSTPRRGTTRACTSSDGSRRRQAARLREFVVCDLAGSSGLLLGALWSALRARVYIRERFTYAAPCRPVVDASVSVTRPRREIHATQSRKTKSLLFRVCTSKVVLYSLACCTPGPLTIVHFSRSVLSRCALCGSDERCDSYVI